MSFWMVVFCIFINAIWVIPLFYEIVYLGIKNSIQTWKKEKELYRLHGIRRLCIECKMCQKKLYKPFYNSLAGASYIPSYCKKFRKRLSGDINQRCISDLPEFAERENHNSQR